MDPRLLATFDESSHACHAWRRAVGVYRIWLATSWQASGSSLEVRLPAWSHGARWRSGAAGHAPDGLPRYCKVIPAGWGNERARTPDGNGRTH